MVFSLGTNVSINPTAVPHLEMSSPPNIFLLTHCIYLVFFLSHPPSFSFSRAQGSQTRGTQPLGVGLAAANTGASRHRVRHRLAAAQEAWKPSPPSSTWRARRSGCACREGTGGSPRPLLRPWGACGGARRGPRWQGRRARVDVESVELYEIYLYECDVEHVKMYDMRWEKK
jgi:hypothetical protein